MPHSGKYGKFLCIMSQGKGKKDMSHGHFTDGQLLLKQ